MKKLYEHFIDWLSGSWPGAIPLPPHVANMKLNEKLLQVHLIKTTIAGTGR
jgi:hypothetical protein